MKNSPHAVKIYLATTKEVTFKMSCVCPAVESAFDQLKICLFSVKFGLKQWKNSSNLHFSLVSTVPPFCFIKYWKEVCVELCLMSSKGILTSGQREKTTVHIYGYKLKSKPTFGIFSLVRKPLFTSATA